MRWLFLVSCLSIYAQYIHAACTSDRMPQGGSLFNVTVPAAAIDQTTKLFPESNPPLSATYDKDVKISFLSQSTMSITFMWEGAGYHNVFGYFLYNPTTQSIISKHTIFPDVTKAAEGGCLVPGVSVNVSRTFNAGEVVGFWILADGYPNATASKGEYYSIHNSTGNVKNPDGYRHTVWTSLSDFNDIVLIGFEDLRNLGDRDYNDVMFYLTINGQYDDGDIPVYNNGTLEVCEPSEILEYNEYNCTQYALLTARNPLACNAYINIEEGWSLAPDNAESREAIKTFGEDAGCIILASGDGYNYLGVKCATGALKSKNFTSSGTCHTVGCDLSVLVIGSRITDCTGQSSAYCDPSTSSKILNQFPSLDTPLPVYPSSYGVFLNKNLGNSAYQTVPFRVEVPDKAKVDVMLLLDFNGLSSSAFDNFKSGLSTIHTRLTNDGFIPSVGFSWIDANGNPNVRSLTPTASTLISQANAVSFSGNAGNGNSKILNAISFVAQSSSAGWRTASYHQIVVITSRNYDSAGLDLAKSAHLDKMVIPVFMSPDNLTSTYTGLASEFLVSRSSSVASSMNNWVTQLAPQVSDIAKRLTFSVANDLSPSFIKFLPPSSIPSVNTMVYKNITVQYPTSIASIIEFPYALNIIVWGYSQITINIYANHAPVVIAPLPFAAYANSSTSFSVSAHDPDENNIFIVYTSVTPAGALGLFTNSKGSALAINSQTMDFGGKFTPNGWNSGNITLSAVIGDGCANTSVNLLFVTLPKPNDPPRSTNLKFTIFEDTTLTFDMPPLTDGDETDPEATLVAIIESLNVGDTRGYFYTDDTATTKLIAGMVLTQSQRRQLYYVPPPNTASNPANSPLATFDFRVQDPQLASSASSYQIAVVVTPLNDPPMYTGEQIITIDEDTVAEISLRDQLKDIDSDPELIVITIGTNVQRGHLYECVETEAGCDRHEFATPYELNLGSNPSGRVIFVPLPDEFGDNYASFQLWANDGTNTSIFTITINVRPVNDPPVIIPFFNVLPQYNEMDEDTELVLTWNVTDIDSPLDSLTVDSRAFPTVFAGKVYQYVANGDDYNRGDEIQATGLIPRFSPGVWKVIVVPNPNVYDNSFVRFRLTAYDDFEAPSLPVNAPVRVLPINDPPVISASEQTLTRTENLQITMGFISVSDIDAGKKDVVVSFTVQDTSVGHFGFDTLTAREEQQNPCTLKADNTSVVCREGLSGLNEKWFKLIIYYPGTTGSQVITVFADDLGHTDKWNRPLNDTKLVIVKIGEDTGLLDPPGTDNTLTIAVAVSVAGAVGAVALVLFLVRDKLSGQTDAYFEALTEPLQSGGINPVYQGAGNSGQNPTYIPRV